MSDASANTALTGPRSYFTWPYQLVVGKYDCMYDWHYLGTTDAHFCTVVSIAGALAQATLVFALADIAVLPQYWVSFLSVAAALVVWYAILTRSRSRLHRAAQLAANNGEANHTNETARIFKELPRHLLDFALFPYYDASGPVTALFAGICTDTAAIYVLYKQLSADRLVGSTVLLILAPCLVVYLYAYHRHCDPGYRGLLRSSWD